MTAAPFPSFTKTYHQTDYDALSPTLPALSAAGRNIVITGGGTGIGAAIALRFAQAHASSISILGRRVSVLKSTQTSIQTQFPDAKVYTYETDVSNKESVATTFKKIFETSGKIDVYVNNHGYLPNGASVKDAHPVEWWKGFEINVLGAFLATQAFLHYKAENAVVINVSSGVSHFLFRPNGSGYTASKEGAVRFFSDVQFENPEIRVVSLHPGMVETDMSAKAGGIGVDDVKLPAGIVVWLASPEADFLKGKYIWANWDVEEMKERKEEIAGSDLLTMQLAGWPGAKTFEKK